MIDEQTEQIRNSFQKALNRHGYGFQFSVLEIAERLAKKVDENERSLWKFLFSEVPVEVQGSGTRIDFILSRSRFNSSSPFFYLICECKRANPALSNWCFVRAPRVRRNQPKGIDSLLIETVIQPNGVAPFKIIASNDHPLRDAYHLGVEVRAAKPGDKNGESGRAIEDAVTQVLRGLNGYLGALSQNNQLVEGTLTYLLPVIFTTAQLWVSSADLGQADLTTGDINLSQDEFRPVPWLWYQYHMSPGLKHTYPSAQKIRSESKSLLNPNIFGRLPLLARAVSRISYSLPLQISTKPPRQTEVTSYLRGEAAGATVARHIPAPRLSGYHQNDDYPNCRRQRGAAPLPPRDSGERISGARANRRSRRW
ncbi:MAG TPA: hypothetical protein VGO56_02740 [Pyrinomonadaceae bacterium]|nr:hypothetical protein [Pyrinomonadaceae bacterium]